MSADARAWTDMRDATPSAALPEALFGGFRALADLPAAVALEEPFTGVHARFYETMMASFHADTSWVLDTLGPRPVTVLDVGCGGGRMTLPLARRGHRVGAVDRAPAMLRQLEHRLQRLDPRARARVRVVQADVHELSLARRCDAVVLGGLTLPLMAGPAERKRLLAAASRCLRPGGQLLFDLNVRDPSAPDADRVDVVPVEDGGRRGFVLVGSRRCHREGVQYGSFYSELLTPDGRTSRTLSWTRSTLLTPEQVEREAAEVGLSIVAHADVTAGTGPGDPVVRMVEARTAG